jgi:hypothetical protein
MNYTDGSIDLTDTAKKGQGDGVIASLFILALSIKLYHDGAHSTHQGEDSGVKLAVLCNGATIGGPGSLFGDELQVGEFKLAKRNLVVHEHHR